MQILFFKLMVFCHERFFRHKRESVLENVSCKEKKGDNTIAQTNGKKSLRCFVYFRIYIEKKQNFAGETNVFQHSFHKTIRSCLNLSHHCFTRLKKKTKVFPLKNLEVLSKDNVILLHNAWFLFKRVLLDNVLRSLRPWNFDLLVNFQLHVDFVNWENDVIVVLICKVNNFASFLRISRHDSFVFSS